MPYSKQTFAYTTGARTFTLALASGYDYESNITVYVEGELTGGGDQIFRDFTFDSEFVINVTDALDNPSSVVVLRTVSPTVFSVDFEAGDDVTKRNLQLAFRQQFFLMQELLDGRVDGVDIVQLAADAASAAALAAIAEDAASTSADEAAASAASIDTDALVRKDGTTAFTAAQTGVAPTSDLHLSTKKYVDDTVGGGGAMLLDGSAQMTGLMVLKDADPTANEHATRKKYVDDGLALKANKASGAFTGNPTVPTQTIGNDSTRIASTAFVEAAIGAGGANAFASALFHLRDEKSAGTHGGTFTSGAWRKRDLNTVLTNEISGASVSSSVITLGTGEYYVKVRIPTRGDVDRTKSQLYKTSGTPATVMLGSSGRNATGDMTDAWVVGRLTVSGSTTFEVQQRSFQSQATYGFGNASDFGDIEVYTEVEIWKVG